MTGTEGLEGPEGPEPTFLRSSIDSTNLNDDLALPEELELSASLILLLSSSTNHQNNNRRLSSSALSIRNSIDADSSFQLSSYFFNTASSSVGISNNTPFNPEESQYIQDIQNDSTSPLGPNSIYKLTVGSDIARQQRNRNPKTHVIINGGQNAIYNLQAPTTQAIPQVQLLPLKTKIKTAELYTKYLNQDQESEYKRFESSDNKLTESMLQKFTTEQETLVSQRVKLVVPEVFSSSDFHLDDPRTFKAIVGNASVLKDSDEHDSAHDSLANNTQIQDGLSQYLDLVEQQLVLEISNSLDLFFSTLDLIQSIEGKSQYSVLIYDDLIAQLTNLKDNTTAHSLQILDQMKKKRNLEKLEFSLLQIQVILQMYDLCISSFAKLDYNLCLKQLILLEHLIAGTAKNDIAPDIDTGFYPDYDLVDMTGIPALWDLQNNAGKLKATCVKQYQTAFINGLLEDLRLHYRSVPQQETLDRLSLYRKKGTSNSGSNIHGKYSVPLSTRDKLKTFIINLSNSGNLLEAYTEYQAHIITEIKDIIKVNLPRKTHSPHLGIGASSPADSTSTSRASSSEPPPNSADVSIDDANLGSSNSALASHAANIKAMSNEDFYSLLAKIFTNTSECLRRLQLHQKLLLDLALSYVDTQIDVFQFDITPALSKAIEITQIRLAKIINVRLELIADLSVDNYLHFYSLTSAFLHECELIAPNFNASGTANTLSDWSRVHVTYFIHRLHLNAVKNLVSESLKEVWKEVSDEKQLSVAQNRVNEILAYSSFVHSQGKNGDPVEQWLKAMDITKDVPECDKLSVNVENSRIVVTQSLFLLPHLGLSAINATRDYFVLLKVFLSRSSTIENYLLTYFKVLNSKTSQAILGAGATRTAGLKHIFPKHMALSIQLVGFVISLLLELRNSFPNSPLSLGPNNSEPKSSSSPSEDVTFSTIISNYKDHQNEIFSKLISMMYDRTVNHCNTIKGIDWSQPIRHPQQCHPFMETLVKDTSTITKVLVKYLPGTEVTLILLQVFDNYKKLFVECFCTQIPPFKDLTEKNTALKDIDYFRVKLGECPGYGNSGQVIWENINSMPTEEDTRMEEVMRNNIAKEMKSQEAKESKIEEEKTTKESVVDVESPTFEPNDKVLSESITEESKKVTAQYVKNDKNDNLPVVALTEESRSASPEKGIPLTPKEISHIKNVEDLEVGNDPKDSKDDSGANGVSPVATDDTVTVSGSKKLGPENGAKGIIHSSNKNEANKNVDVNINDSETVTESLEELKEEEPIVRTEMNENVTTESNTEDKSKDIEEEKKEEEPNGEEKVEKSDITEEKLEDKTEGKLEVKLEDKKVEHIFDEQDKYGNRLEEVENKHDEKTTDSTETASNVSSVKRVVEDESGVESEAQMKEQPSNEAVEGDEFKLKPQLDPPTEALPPQTANKSPKKKKNNKRKNKKR